MGPRCVMFMYLDSKVFLFLSVLSAAVIIIEMGVSDLMFLLIILYVRLEECALVDLNYFSVH